MTIYTRTDLNQILRAYEEEFNFDQTTPRVLRTLSTHKLLENGLWLVGYDPSISAGETPAERTLFEWHPRQNIDLPALPIPFTENELAAFFLDGGGWFLHQHFRDSSANGLSDDALEGLRENSANARDALQQAHAQYLLAASRFDLNDDAGIRGAAEWLLQPADDVMPVVTPVNDGQRRVPMSVFLAQESELLHAIQEAGYEAKALPIRKPRVRGVKAEIRAKLKDHRLFVGEKKFDKAWDRLRGTKEIGDSSSPALE